MMISFKDRKDERDFNHEWKIKGRWGLQADKIKRRFSELRAMENLSILRTIPQLHTHELTGHRKEEIEGRSLSRQASITNY